MLVGVDTIVAYWNSSVFVNICKSSEFLQNISHLSKCQCASPGLRSPRSTSLTVQIPFVERNQPPSS